MNWVGGSRIRCMKNSDVKKQTAFFEKRRRQKWLNPQGPPLSPEGGTAGNVDLLTMFIANQIALKKEHTDKGNPKITHLAKSKGAFKSMSQPLELPMSPCAPSCLNLMESEPRYSVHAEGLKKRKQSLLEEFKVKLSPVMEVNQSDNSALDYMHKHHHQHHHHQGSISSFSSASPSPSEGFQPRPSAHISQPPAWECYSTQTPELRLFSQPAEVCEFDSWMTVSHQTQPSHTSPVTGAQYGSPLHSTNTSGPSVHPADESPPTEHQEKPIFLEFNSEEDGDQEIFGERMININPQETPCMRPHDFSDLNTTEYSVDFLPQENTQHMQPGETTPPTESQYCSSEMNITRRVLSFSQKVMFNSQRERASKAQGGLRSMRWASCGLDCEEDQFVPSCPQTDSQSVGKREKTSSRIRDMGTQTAAASTSACQDASVQCCLLKAEKRPSVSTEHTAPFHQHSTRKSKKAPTSTTRRHTGKSNGDLLKVTQCALSDVHKVKWNTLWNTATKREATQQAPGAITGQESSRKSEGPACTDNKHPVPVQNSSQGKAAAESKEEPSGNIVVRGERCEGHEEESVNPNPAENAWSSEEHGRERGVNWVSGETESLQEIADILLMLKQKNKPE